MNNQKPNIIVAVSGGVDSAVAAILLKEKYSNIQAVYMRNWDSFLNNDVHGHKKELNGCTDQEDLNSAKNICEKLNIPLKIYNFVEQYWNEVFQPSLDELKKGLTPNPDVLCNQKIKFGYLLKMIQNDYGNDIKIATGHYAKVIKQNEQFYLGTANDKHKDQTYFLNQISLDQLKRIVFPLGDIIDKDVVRNIAKKYHLDVWNRPDSTGICFIGERNYKKFLTNYLENKKGDIIAVESNKKIAEHDGLSFYTFGQRKGLNLGGNVEPYFVCGKNILKNQLFVCQKKDFEKYMFLNQTKVINVNIINGKLKINDEVKLRYRHNGKLFLAKISKIENNIYYFNHEKLYPTAPGQYVVIYDKNETICYGGGIYENEKIMDYIND